MSTIRRVVGARQARCVASSVTLPLSEVKYSRHPDVGTASLRRSRGKCFFKIDSNCMRSSSRVTIGKTPIVQVCNVCLPACARQPRGEGPAIDFFDFFLCVLAFHPAICNRWRGFWKCLPHAKKRRSSTYVATLRRNFFSKFFRRGNIILRDDTRENNSCDSPKNSTTSQAQK